MAILVVDDDPGIREEIEAYISGHGYRVYTAAAAVQMDEVLKAQSIQLLLLDIMMPGEDGLSVCRRLSAKSDLQIILMSARGADVDRIVGLELGADHYLPKPFNPRELLARIRAVLRRVADSSPAEKPAAQSYGFAGFVASPTSRRVLDPTGAEIILTGAEYDLLQVFLDRPGRVLSRDQLLDLTQGREADPLERSIDVLMSRLRRKLNDSSLFKTVRNGGYQFAARVEPVDVAL